MKIIADVFFFRYLFNQPLSLGNGLALYGILILHIFLTHVSILDYSVKEGNNKIHTSTSNKEKEETKISST